ncbi:BTB and MATH domain-containing protein 36-like [Porites lutea]|uniref:BTB and MATH domain-containing protein 36-like n=1 Tax=Porites lutea TaxID=51062 RepID=UPI003CC64066
MFGSRSVPFFFKSDQEDSLDFSQPWQFSDVVLVVEEDRFHVHRCILGMWSEVFTSQFKEKTAEEIPLPGKKSAEIKEILLVIYPTSAKPIYESNYAFLLDLAKEYVMAKLTEKCETYLMDQLFSTPGVFGIPSRKDYCLELLEIAQNHGLNRLQMACIEKTKEMKFKDLKNHNMYEKISSSNFRKIVEGMFEIYERKLAGR